MINKKNLAIVFFSLLFCVFAEGNYNNGNGTVISRKKTKNEIIEVRRHNQDVEIGELARESDKIIYSDIYRTKELCRLNLKDIIKISEVWIERDRKRDLEQVFLKVEFEGYKGFIVYSGIVYDSYQKKDILETKKNPYRDNNWEILSVINSSGRIWTERKCINKFLVYDRLNVRATPGLQGEKVYLLKGTDNGIQPPMGIEVISITEETETIDGRTDPWLKIEYEPRKFGWVFGGYVDAEKGGNMYFIPEDEFKFQLGWY